MGRRKPLSEMIAERSDLLDEVFPGQPLVEMMGDRRILIEHHCGVNRYSTNVISIQMKYGQVQINGEKLELAKMCGKQLVITGRIDSVSVIRGK